MAESLTRDRTAARRRSPRRCGGFLPLARCLGTRDGGIRLDIPDGVLPGFLIAAYNGSVQGGGVSLSPSECATVERMETEGLPGARLALLVTAVVLERTGDLHGACRAYETLVARDPHPLVLHQVASLYRRSKRYAAALTYRRRALAGLPRDTGLLNIYLGDLLRTRHWAEAEAVRTELLARDGLDPLVHSHHLICLHYRPEVDAASLRDAHRAWARLHAPADRARTDHPNDPDPRRRLRVGYVSADFRRHAAAYNFEAVLRGRDPAQVEVFGYGHVAEPDAVTERLRGEFDHYRPVYGLDDAALAAQVAADGIDILVAVAGHGGAHRLTAFAHKPAPIQVDYQGINTTGMTQIDYRLTDRWMCPPDRERDYVETAVFLDPGVMCYTPPRDAPAVRPREPDAPLTFASLNHHVKITTESLRLWARILRRRPGSRLLLKCDDPTDTAFRAALAEALAEQGVEAARVRLIGWLPENHLDLLHEVDLALDAFPFNGCITTLESLWMGVPVVSQVGPDMVSRAGYVLLDRLGLGDLVADGPEAYVETALRLADDRSRRVALRRDLRGRMAGGATCDAAAHARALERAYRFMWYRWCRQRGVTVSVPEPEGLFGGDPARP